MHKSPREQHRATRAALVLTSYMALFKQCSLLVVPPWPVPALIGRRGGVVVVTATLVAWVTWLALVVWCTTTIARATALVGRRLVATCKRGRRVDTWPSTLVVSRVVAKIGWAWSILHVATRITLVALVTSLVPRGWGTLVSRGRRCILIVWSTSWNIARLWVWGMGLVIWWGTRRRWRALWRTPWRSSIMGWHLALPWWSRPALVGLCVLPSPFKVPRPVKVARPVVAPGSLIGTGIVSHPLLMVFGVVRNSLSIYKWFSSIVLISDIKV